MGEQTQNNDQSSAEPPSTDPAQIAKVQRANVEKPGLTFSGVLRNRRYWKFAAGFVGWFVVNGLVWWILSGGFNAIADDLFENAGANCILLPLNLVFLFGLTRDLRTRPIAGGILAAIGVNLIVSLVLGAALNAFCLVRFFN